MFKIAIVTPYYIQTEAILRQCQASVRAQTYPCTHIAVADGHPSPVFDTPAGLHVILPQSNRDVGNTPRMIGALLAASYGFDAVAWLDDDNWFEPGHIAALVKAHRQSGDPLVTAKRIFRHLNGAILPFTEQKEDRFEHVDTNCWLVFRPAFSLFTAWGLPKKFAELGDRIFLQKARHERFRITETQSRTVNYVTKFPFHYRRAGVPVPDGAYTKDHCLDSLVHTRTVEGAAELAAAAGFYPSLYY